MFNADIEKCVIGVNDVPKKVMEWFEKRSEMYVSDYKPGNWLSFWKLGLPTGSTIWVASQIKKYGGRAGTEHVHHFYQALGSEMIGYAELRFHLDQERPFFKGKPFVGFNETERAFRRKGFAMQRMMVMDLFARTVHGYRLTSDTVIDVKAEMAWRKLVKQGLAKEFIEGESPRWQMVA